MTIIKQEEFQGAKSAYHTFLKGNVARIKFKKVNGDIRDMRCTLREDLLPPVTESATTKRQHDANDEVVAVYDLDAEGWRSFRIDNVIEMEIANND
jgi:hypothetical protein